MISISLHNWKKKIALSWTLNWVDMHHVTCYNILNHYTTALCSDMCQALPCRLDSVQASHQACCKFLTENEGQNFLKICSDHHLGLSPIFRDPPKQINKFPAKWWGCGLLANDFSFTIFGLPVNLICLMWFSGRFQDPWIPTKIYGSKLRNTWILTHTCQNCQKLVRSLIFTLGCSVVSYNPWYVWKHSLIHHPQVLYPSEAYCWWQTWCFVFAWRACQIK